MKTRFSRTAALTAGVVCLASAHLATLPAAGAVAVPKEYATTQFSGTKGTLKVGAHQMPFGMTRTTTGDANSMAAVEAELQEGILDPATGEPVVSEVDTSLVLLSPGVVNFSQSPFEAGYFNASNTPDHPDEPMPGYVAGNDYALQFVGFAELNPGTYRMFVNSDDGFKLSFGPNTLDVLGTTVGLFDTGRGHTLNADPEGFEFEITEAGVYPFRLIFGQGGGDANVEWYAQDLITGERTLINAGVPAAVLTYPEGRGRAYVKSFLPYPGTVGVDIQPTLKVVLVDDLTTVVDSSVQVILDGTELTGVTKTRNGTTLTVTWTPTASYAVGSKHAGQFIFAENNGLSRTNAFDFTIKGFQPADFPDNSFWIEIEDFDYGAGQYVAEADDAIGTSPNPYLGGGYQGDLLPSGAVHDTDYHRGGVGPLDGSNPGGYVYRTDIPAWIDQDNLQTDYFVPMFSYLGNAVGTTRPGEITVTANYKTGWSGGGSWYNYTRTLPTGMYSAFLAGSHWSDAAADNPGLIDYTLDKVLTGVGTSNQTLQRLASVNNNQIVGTANILLPLVGPDGGLAVFKLGGKTTLRIAGTAGDIDYFVLAPQAGVPPKVIEATPANNAVVSPSTPIAARIEDFSTAAVLNTVKLILDGQDVTTQASPMKTADITTLQYTHPTPWVVGSSHTYIIRYADNATPAKDYAVTNVFDVSPLGVPNQFLIEAEDFNYEGGKTRPEASVMPYLGLAYEGLNAVFDVDYSSTDTIAPGQGWVPAYRTGDPVADGTTAPLTVNGGIEANRGTWDVTTNYKIGWVGGTDFYNYTRTFPAGNYRVYSAQSADGYELSGTMELVSNPSAVNAEQIRVSIGSFQAPETGAWGRNALVPMQDANGNPATVSLSGEQTIRYNVTSGDMDYFLLVPVTETEAPKITHIQRNANGSFTIEWTGGGVLQATTSLTPPVQWDDVTGATSPHTFTPTTSQLFGRIKK
ncbi:MAG: hypothetical protein ACYDC1_02835 [Limisphaerales bacterium]